MSRQGWQPSTGPSRLHGWQPSTGPSRLHGWQPSSGPSRLHGWQPSTGPSRLHGWLGALLLALLVLAILSPQARAESSPVDGALAQMLSSKPEQWDSILSKYDGQLNKEMLEPVLERGLKLAARGKDREALSMLVANDYIDYYLGGKQKYRGVGQITLATYLMRLNQGARAAVVVEQLAATHPELSAAQVLQGRMIIYSDTKGALAYFQKAVELEPESESGHLGIADAYLLLGNVAKARKAYEKVLSINPDNGYARDAIKTLSSPGGGMPTSASKQADKHFEQAEALFTAGKFKEAIKEYDAALAADPGFAKAHIYKGDAYFQLGELDKAVACYRQAIKADPKDKQAYRFLGDVLERQYEVRDDMKLLDEAIRCYQKALQLDPDYSAAASDLARAREKKSKATKP